ncbi:MAG: hypothetical protein NTW29_07870 [Bacteroidetes bacterium]|nr:hypothetical protein [Bacteroidota bacterium]
MTVKRNKRHCRLSLTGGIFLLLILCWLSVCLPFQYQSQHQTNRFQTEEQDVNCGILLEDLDEKAPFTTEEFLSFANSASVHQSAPLCFSDNGAVIINACHRELFSPPPNRA